MSRGTKLTIGGFLSFWLLAGLFTGCSERQGDDAPLVRFDEAAFRKVLTLFFDGVPPLDHAMVEPGTTDPNVLTAGKRPDVKWYIHAPLNDCVRCHGNRQQESFSREVQLVARVPDLCHGCHEAFVPTALKGWVHGPVAVGQCLTCHEPHKTQNPHLLREPIPAVCYTCHQEMLDELAPGATDPHSQCTECHAAHVGATQQATKRTPELCYDCHEDLAPSALKGWVHGPMAVGQCLICHDVHKIQNPHLLRERIPGICYACHEESAVKTIPDHWNDSFADCSACHEPHASPERPLLKQSKPPNIAEGQPAESAEHAVRASGPARAGVLSDSKGPAPGTVR